MCTWKPLKIDLLHNWLKIETINPYIIIPTVTQTIRTVHLTGNQGIFLEEIYQTARIGKIFEYEALHMQQFENQWLSWENFQWPQLTQFGWINMN